MDNQDEVRSVVGRARVLILSVVLTVGGVLANCVPVGDFTATAVVTLPAPSAPPVSAPAADVLNPTDGSSQYALRHTTRFAPPGVPRYLLTATLLI